MIHLVTGSVRYVSDINTWLIRIRYYYFSFCYSNACYSPPPTPHLLLSFFLPLSQSAVFFAVARALSSSLTSAVSHNDIFETHSRNYPRHLNESLIDDLVSLTRLFIICLVCISDGIPDDDPAETYDFSTLFPRYDYLCLRPRLFHFFFFWTANLQRLMAITVEYFGSLGFLDAVKSYLRSFVSSSFFCVELACQTRKEGKILVYKSLRAVARVLFHFYARDKVRIGNDIPRSASFWS